MLILHQKSRGDWRRLAVTQTPVRNHRLTLVWKTRKGVNNNNNNNNNNNDNNNYNNNNNKLLRDFNIQTDHLIPARRPDLIIINNKKKIEFAKFLTLLSKLTTEKK